MECRFEKLRGGAVPPHSRLARRWPQSFGPAALLALALALQSSRGRADLGEDLARVERALSAQTRVERLRVRLLERDDVTPIALPPWALDPAQGECTTLVLLAPVPTQFILQVHPWPGLQGSFASSAGAAQVTRCGKDRVSLLQVLVEMRSPRAVLHTLVAVGPAPPPPLVSALPKRDTGVGAAAGEPGPALPREPLAERLKRFELAAGRDGALAVETPQLSTAGRLRVTLAPGCHRLLSAAQDGAEPARLALQEGDVEQPRELLPSQQGDVRQELCVARERSLTISTNVSEQPAVPSLAVAHFPLPVGLPGRFGPEVAERLAEALGGTRAPRRLGPLVAVSLGAQGRTPLPRQLLTHTCYLAVATLLHGEAQALSLGVEAGPSNAEATSPGSKPGPRVSFCTGKDAQVAIDVEARGLGVAWLFFLFQVGPSPAEAP